MNGENKNIIKCDFCDTGAVINFQKAWMRFTIDKNGEYREDRKFLACDLEEPIEGDNIHLCKEHSEKWLKGEI